MHTVAISQDIVENGLFFSLSRKVGRDILMFLFRAFNKLQNSSYTIPISHLIFCKIKENNISFHRD